MRSRVLALVAVAAALAVLVGVGEALAQDRGAGGAQGTGAAERGGAAEKGTAGGHAYHGKILKVDAQKRELTFLSWNHFVPACDDELRKQADNLRNRGMSIRPPDTNPPNPPPATTGAPQGAGGTLP